MPVYWVDFAIHGSGAIEVEAASAQDALAVVGRMNAQRVLIDLREGGSAVQPLEARPVTHWRGDIVDGERASATPGACIFCRDAWMHTISPETPDGTGPRCDLVDRRQFSK